MDLFHILSLSFTIISLVIAFFSMRSARTQARIAKKQAELAEQKSIELEIAQKRNFTCAQLFGDNDEYIDHVGDVLDHLENLLIDLANSGQPIQIENFGLDLETVVPWFKKDVCRNIKLKDAVIEYKGLIIDHESDSLKPLINANSDIQSDIAESRINEVKAFDFYQRQNLKVELRKYAQPPIIHGFLVNNKYLFLSFTEIKKGKLQGGYLPYIYIEYNKTSLMNQHFFEMFKTWFDYIYHNSPLVYRNYNDKNCA